MYGIILDQSGQEAHVIYKDTIGVKGNQHTGGIEPVCIAKIEFVAVSGVRTKYRC